MYDNTINTVNNYLNNYTNSTSNSSSSVDSNFGSLLATFMQMRINNSLAGIADFSNTGTSSSSNSSSDLFGLNNNMFGSSGSSLSALSGLSGLSDVYGSSSGLSALSLLSGLYGGGDMFGSSSSSLFGSGSSGSLGGDMMMLLSIITLSSLFSNYSYNSNSSNAVTQSKAVNAYNTSKGALVTPTDASKKTSGGLYNVAGRRSASTYSAVAKQFNVAGNARYQPRNGNTYCNIFTWDVTRAMGAEIPHWVDSSGNIATSTTSGARELTANGMTTWLQQHGSRYGWKKVSAEEAQNYANAGSPAVVMNYNSSGGHTSVVIPSPDGKYHADKGAYIAQAGSTLTNGDWMTNVYSANRMKQVEYWVHA